MEYACSHSIASTCPHYNESNCDATRDRTAGAPPNHLLAEMLQRIHNLEAEQLRNKATIQDLVSLLQPSAASMDRRDAPGRPCNDGHYAVPRGNADGKRPAECGPASGASQIPPPVPDGFEHLRGKQKAQHRPAVPSGFEHLCGKKQLLACPNTAGGLDSALVQIVGAAIGLRDGDANLDTILKEVWKVPGVKILILACAYHVVLKMKKTQGLLKDRDIFGLFLKQIQDLKTKAVVPIAVPTIFNLMITEWKKKGQGATQFATGIDQYVQECGGLYTTQSIANLLSPFSGTPPENEGIESNQKYIQEECCIQRKTTLHVAEILDYLRLRSQRDTGMSPKLRTEVWGPQFFEDVHTFMHVQLYDDDVGPKKRAAVNPIECAIQCKVPVCTLSSQQSDSNDQPGTLKFAVPGDIMRPMRDVLFVPTPGTIRALIASLGPPKKRKVGAAARVEWTNCCTGAADVKKLLKAACEDGSPSWIDTVCALFQDPVEVVRKRGWKFDDYIQWSDSFRYLIAVTDEGEREAMLRLMEQGTDTPWSSAFRNGARVDRSKISHKTPMRRCLCSMFLRRRMCICVVAYCISTGIIQIPSSFDSRPYSSPTKRGRPYGSKQGDCWGPHHTGQRSVAAMWVSEDTDHLVDLLLERLMPLPMNKIQQEVLRTKCVVKLTEDGRGYGLFATETVQPGVVIAILSSGAVMKEPSLRCVKLPSNPPTFQQYVDPNSFYKGSVDRMKDVNEYALRGSLVNEPQSGSRTYNCCILFVPKKKGAVKRNQMTVLVTTQSVRSGEEFLTHYGDDPNWRHRDTPRSRDTPRASRRELGLSSPGQGADGTRSWTGASPII